MNNKRKNVYEEPSKSAFKKNKNLLDQEERIKDHINRSLGYKIESNSHKKEVICLLVELLSSDLMNAIFVKKLDIPIILESNDFIDQLGNTVINASKMSFSVKKINEYQVIESYEQVMNKSNSMYEITINDLGFFSLEAWRNITKFPFYLSSWINFKLNEIKIIVNFDQSSGLKRVDMDDIVQKRGKSIIELTQPIGYEDLSEIGKKITCSITKDVYDANEIIESTSTKLALEYEPSEHVIAYKKRLMELDVTGDFIKKDSESLSRWLFQNYVQEQDEKNKTELYILLRIVPLYRLYSTIGFCDKEWNKSLLSVEFMYPPVLTLETIEYICKTNNPMIIDVFFFDNQMSTTLGTANCQFIIDKSRMDPKNKFY